MIAKYLHERRELSETVDYLDEHPSFGGEKGKVTLEYYVITEDDEFATIHASERDAQYGVMVVMNRNRLNNEVKWLSDVTPFEDEARKYARILADHCVTPCSMVDVMEDLIAKDASL